MRRVLPLFLLLAGCARTPDIEASKLDQLQNTYELTPRAGWVSFSGNDAKTTGALMAKATDICGSGNVAILDTGRPNYISLPMTPRGYLHCR
ncbi:MAG TPA: hypothetical protein VNH44_04230 [Micropepsaceae bacterium]|nr:hypothetical protein [Micropepsaceae bacterium]